MSWKDILKSKGWYAQGTLSKAQLKDYHRRFRLEFLKRLSGNEEQEALQYLDLLERAIKNFGTDKVSFMTPEYVVGQLNGILDKAGINPEKEAVRDLE